MDLDRLKVLIKKYEEGTITTGERKELEAWFNALNYPANEQNNPLLEKELESRMFRDFQKKLDQTPVAASGNIRPIRSKSSQQVDYRKWISAAASVIVVIGLLYFFRNPNHLAATNQPHLLTAAVKPGSHRATLMLSSGTQLRIDEQPDGKLITDHNYQISRRGNQLTYTNLPAGTIANDPASGYNTITTPRGGEYETVLPDGTHVWLNAGSSIRFPLNFNSDIRQVTLTGEAYFEVAKLTTADHHRIPFEVTSGTQTVEVLGTHFNIKAYANDDAINTTLAQGSVRVFDNRDKTKAKQALLVPGQQAAFLTKAGDLSSAIIVSQADMDEALAWHNNRFSFSNRSLKLVMHELERWYNIDVDYAGLPDKKFNGSIPRNLELIKVLHVLEKTSGCKFKIEAINQPNGKEERRLVMDK